MTHPSSTVEAASRRSPLPKPIGKQGLVHKGSILIKASAGNEGETSIREGLPIWPNKKLGDLCELITKGSSPNWQGFDYCEKGIVFVRSQNVGWGELNVSEVAHLPEAFNQKERKSVLKAGDVLLNLVGASIGRACVATEEVDGGNINQAVALIRPKRELLTPRFLMLFLISPAAQKAIHAEKVDVARANFSLEDTRSLEIPLPPLPEQHRIVAEIEKQFTRLDVGVGALKRVQANLKRYRAAVLKAACEGKLVPTEAELMAVAAASRRSSKNQQNQNGSPTFETSEQLLTRILAERRKNWQGRGNYKEPVAPDVTDLPPIPEGWTWASVAQLSFLDVGFAFKSTEFENSGVRLLRGENIEPGRMRWADTRYWPETRLDDFQHLLLRDGQIVLAMDRPLISSGLKIARMRADDLPCLLVQRMARFRPVLEIMTSFLFTALNTHSFIKHLLGGQTGTQLPHISGEGIQSFLIALPPLAEQTRIVAEVERRLSVINELEEVISANLQRAVRLRQFILQKSFSGKLFASEI